ncbi:hypothetical protein ABW21_db0202679 [Orbilia brochopaga]|nr:hypothetical protein ABW21_db0202679 [Drechslerella brochopaga]
MDRQPGTRGFFEPSDQQATIRDNRRADRPHISSVQDIKGHHMEDFLFETYNPGFTSRVRGAVPNYHRPTLSTNQHLYLQPTSTEPSEAPTAGTHGFGTSSVAESTALYSWADTATDPGNLLDAHQAQPPSRSNAFMRPTRPRHKRKERSPPTPPRLGKLNPEDEYYDNFIYEEYRPPPKKGSTESQSTPMGQSSMDHCSDSDLMRRYATTLFQADPIKYFGLRDVAERAPTKVTEKEENHLNQMAHRPFPDPLKTMKEKRDAADATSSHPGTQQPRKRIGKKMKTEAEGEYYTEYSSGQKGRANWEDNFVLRFPDLPIPPAAPTFRPTVIALLHAGKTNRGPQDFTQRIINVIEKCEDENYRRLLVEKLKGIREPDSRRAQDRGPAPGPAPSQSSRPSHAQSTDNQTGGRVQRPHNQAPVYGPDLPAPSTRPPPHDPTTSNPALPDYSQYDPSQGLDFGNTATEDQAGFFPADTASYDFFANNSYVAQATSYAMGASPMMSSAQMGAFDAAITFPSLEDPRSGPQ